MPTPWSNIEVELIVTDYFNMLSAELKGEPYSKADHRRAILPLLSNRSEGSVEFKHQNVSAVLIELGQPFIRGYLPRFNYQKTLKESIIDYLAQNAHIETNFQLFADKKIVKMSTPFNYEKLLVLPPKTNMVSEPKPANKRNPIKVNYLEREQRNRSLGILGEEVVLEYEKWNLKKNGKEKLAKQIVWVSKEEGDGAGYDILSKQTNGTDKYIEVKTTKLAKETPIFFSKNELDFSINHTNDFHLYRLFSFETDAKMFIKNGALNDMCTAYPINYKGFF